LRAVSPRTPSHLPVLPHHVNRFRSRVSSARVLSRLQVVFERGVYLPEIDLWLDSLRKKDTSLISHAHSDHTARHLRPVLTPNTLLLLADYLKKSDPIPLSYHEPLDCGKYTLTLYPAGHCLGSAQSLIESKSTGERVLYTGDIKVKPSPTNEPLSWKQPTAAPSMFSRIRTRYCPPLAIPCETGYLRGVNP